ncbi:diguanylate cyclase (GGDEF)-like protein [Paraburkholderia sp. BL18I3N2]|uniref:sensor domain-containing diguanylate cyclase n=1 Tax=Paraburkholderia sp. BL18I3N2 TaxID=1938799 RepID=UPI000D06993B|nr:sensor domain-containing diguanylate cyclase [Paraburkholderia sp. BL18I3N2]PRX27001.1 diguanylate cyclase (GGDEF)-like protein [Paraburkholderia sp. BL18I3N2]
MDRTIYATKSTRSSRHALILVPALTVLVLGILWVTILLRLQVEKASVMRDTRVAARTLADALETHTLKTIHDVDEIALLVKYGYERTPQTFDLAAYRAYGLITADTALQVTIAGADGHAIASTLPFTGTVDLKDREHFRVHLSPENIGLFISQPVIGRISKQWSVQATRRIDRPDGSFGGVVIVSEDPAYLTDGFYNNAALGERGMIAVLSGRGFMLSRRAGNSPSRSGEALPSSYVPLGKTGLADFSDPIDHVERVVASRHLEKYGLTVVAGLAVDEALDDYFRMRRVYVTMASTITVMLAALSAWITALIVKLLNGKEELRRLSQTDRLTDLPNRGKIVDLLDEAIAAPGAVGKVAVVFVDLDNFKELNDTYGHQCGDEILALVAARLHATLQQRGVVGRLGGDEFLVVLETDAITGAVGQMVAELTAALQVPLNSRWGVEAVGASFGMAILKAGEDSDELIRKADIAMYQAKNRDPACRIDSNTDHILAG